MLLAEVDAIRVSGKPEVIGALFEEEFRAFLTRLMPASISVVPGFIVEENGRDSSHFDALLIDNSHPFLGSIGPRMLADGGYKTIKDMALHAISQHSVRDIIIEKINKKLSKVYPEGTILLISVSGDATGEDDEVVQGWLPQIRRSAALGNFSEIYIVEEARSRLFKIF